MKRAFYLRCAGAALIALLVCAGTDARAGTWSIGVLDSGGDAGRYCSLIIDGDGNLHAVYLHSDLGMIKIVSRIGDVWQTPDTVVSTGSNGHCDIAVSQTGDTRISYHRSDIGALGYAGPEPIDTWSVGQITSSSDNIGLAMSAVPHTGGAISLTCRNTTAGSLLLLTRGDLGAWSAPQTIDPGPNRALHSDHAFHAGNGYAFCEYDSGNGMLLYADSVRHRNEWGIGAVTLSADDIGQWASTARRPTGELSLSCRNSTAGSLLLLTRDELGVWSAPQTIDPGPNRGSNSDHAYRPGVGYAFSEYASGDGMLLYADQTEASHEWKLGTIYGTSNSGTYPSAVLAPDGRVASAFYVYDESILGRVYLAGLHPTGYAAVKALDDTIGNDPAESVHIDLALTPDWGWHLSYRNGLDSHLWYAHRDSFVITAVDEERALETPPPSALRLHQGYPNPFNPAAVIAYEVPAPGMVSLRVYDAGGRLVRTLANEMKLPGAYRATWDGSNDRGARVASGVYFIRLSQGSAAQTRKAILLR